MINVKSQIFAALSGLADNVSDGYPEDFRTLPAVAYTEEENSVYEHTDGAEQKARLRYRVDVWNKASTSDTALAVDDALSALGLLRTMCQDVADPSGLRHKVLRFEGVIDVNTEEMYHNNSIY